MTNLTENLNEIIETTYKQGFKTFYDIYYKLLSEYNELKIDKSLQYQVKVAIGIFLRERGLNTKTIYGKKDKPEDNKIHIRIRRQNEAVIRGIPRAKPINNKWLQDASGGEIITNFTPNFDPLLYNPSELEAGYKALFQGRSVNNDKDIFDIVYGSRTLLRHRIICTAELFGDKGRAIIEIGGLLIEERDLLFEHFRGKTIDSSSGLWALASAFLEKYSDRGIWQVDIIQDAGTTFTVSNINSRFTMR